MWDSRAAAPACDRTHQARNWRTLRPAVRRIYYSYGVDCVVDLDPTHRVLRITVTTALADEACTDIYRTVARLASRGGPYAAITDLSQVADFPVSYKTVRALA